MSLKIAYLGIDLLQCALRTALEQGCQVLKVYTCPTDNVTEFNTGVLALARDNGIPVSLERVREADLAWLAGQGCQLLLCGGYYHRLPVTGAFPMVNIHPAPLPRFRGAWPMPVMLLRGERRGGVALHKVAADFDTGDLLLEEEFPLPPDATLADYMGQVERVLPGMVRQLLRELPALLDSARPQGEGAYWPCPTEADWTITPETPASGADAILRAFFGYECLYRAGGRAFELIGGRVFPQPGPEGGFPVRGGWIRAPRVRELKGHG